MLSKFNEMTEEQAIYYRMAVRDCYCVLFNRDHKLLVPNVVESKITNLENRAIKRLMQLGTIPKLKKCDDPKCKFPTKGMESVCCGCA
jgi:hypothetical protein